MSPNTPDRLGFGRAISEALEVSGLTRRQVAGRADMSTFTLRRLMRDGGKLNADQLEDLADALGVPLMNLVQIACSFKRLDGLAATAREHGVASLPRHYQRMRFASGGPVYGRSKDGQWGDTSLDRPPITDEQVDQWLADGVVVLVRTVRRSSPPLRVTRQSEAVVRSLGVGAGAS
ncbi:hypothetical protein BN12_220035 [Nostocoides japonicum T1-X7]|uniref:HTH cro/C1-type domain-containing protein n=1 Tax=Nostocoides japonicum T1-X7 TaxID=1194083 RepID=A0A077LXY3_9MICO|nr:helix-turn-helix transcriptional regulator [Tetrasphaera japonica]CCH77757.1 hypothetical protein BN12_220035 [Tetrasphaera japonica T1-X7]